MAHLFYDHHKIVFECNLYFSANIASRWYAIFAIIYVYNELLNFL